MITMHQTGGGAVLKIQGELKIGSVADAKIEFVRALAACSELRVDVSELGQCDTAGIQFHGWRQCPRQRQRIWIDRRHRLVLLRARACRYSRRVLCSPDGTRRFAGTIMTADEAAGIGGALQ